MGQTSKNHVPDIQCLDGTLVSDIANKLQVFLDYYNTLYTAEPTTDQEIGDFLASAAILKVKEEAEQV